MKYQQFSKCAIIFVTASALLFNCSKKKEEDPTPVEIPTPAPVVKTTTYSFNGEVGLGGKITFTEVSASQTKVELEVIGASTAELHPAHIHFNSAVETGGIYETLTKVDATGKSSTIVPRSYSTLIDFDGYINVHKADSALGTIIAQSDIGGNTLTGKSKSYTILPEVGSSVGGTILFKERKNGFTLATVVLANVSPGEIYGVTLNTGSASSVNSVLDVTLKDVDGKIKVSQTNIKVIDGTSVQIKYSNILSDPRFVKVTNKSNSLVAIAKANIGSNVAN